MRGTRRSRSRMGRRSAMRRPASASRMMLAPRSPLVNTVVLQPAKVTASSSSSTA